MRSFTSMTAEEIEDYIEIHGLDDAMFMQLHKQAQQMIGFLNDMLSEKERQLKQATGE